jgi:two-component system cell cycle sensor histidine kinase/response regulator CckA
MRKNPREGSMQGHSKSLLKIGTSTAQRNALEAQLLRSQRLESIGTLAGGISHDLNNVLTPILSGLQILKRKITDTQTLNLLETLEASAQRGSDIVKQVLSFARGVEGEKILLQPKYLIVELDKIIRETFPKSIQFIRFTSRDLWTLLGDVTQLHQIFLNLCVNARDAMPNGGILTVKADNIIIDENYVRMNPEAKPGPYVVMTVTDTGSGIPPGIMDRIFEPFFTTKEQELGTGLGLATVKALVKAHGGFVNVYSEIGKGTSFKVYLPAAGAEKIHGDVQHKNGFVSGNGEVILVVDDENSILEITKETLETFGYRALTAHDGTEAVVQLAENRGNIDAVITDMMMPYMDGPATIRALRRIDPQIKIIATSGLSIDKRIAEAHNLDVQAFVTKPYTAEDLLTALCEVLRNVPEVIEGGIQRTPDDF